MKIYLAAPYQKKDYTNVCAAELRAGGVEVTSSWLEEIHDPSIHMKDLTPAEHMKYALQDVKDVQAADILILFTDPTQSIVRAGRHVEFGIAVQRRIPIYVVGEEYENIFHHLGNVTHFASWEGLRDWLIKKASSENNIIMSCW